MKLELINPEQGIIPARSTQQAAGYDFVASEDVTIPVFHPGVKPVLVRTGVRVSMPADEYLLLANRSSSPIKRGLIMANGVGIIDADYTQEIKGMFYNFSDEAVTIKKGDRVFQGVFQHYDVTDDDADAVKTERTGGFGSTDTDVSTEHQATTTNNWKSELKDYAFWIFVTILFLVLFYMAVAAF